MRLFGRTVDYVVGTAPDAVPGAIRDIIDTVVRDYAYLLMK